MRLPAWWECVSLCVSCNAVKGQTFYCCNNAHHVSVSFQTSPVSFNAIDSGDFLLDRRHGQDKTVLSCLCRRCEHIWRQDKTGLSCFDPVSTFQVFSSPQYIWDWTVANLVMGRDKTKYCLLVFSCRQHKTKQFCLVRVGGVNKLYITDRATVSVVCAALLRRKSTSGFWFGHAWYLGRPRAIGVPNFDQISQSAAEILEIASQIYFRFLVWPQE